jgi:hypothetical protein
MVAERAQRGRQEAEAFVGHPHLARGGRDRAGIPKCFRAAQPYQGRCERRTQNDADPDPWHLGTVPRVQARGDTTRLWLGGGCRAALIARSRIDLPGCIEIQQKNAEADNQIRQRRKCYGRDDPGRDDRDIRQRVVSRREERRAREASAMGSEAGETKGAVEITARAPKPASDRGTGAGGTGSWSFCHAVHSVATTGASRTAARIIPTVERCRAVHPSATRISPLTVASSRKSIESANSDTDSIVSAIANSTPK